MEKKTLHIDVLNKIATYRSRDGIIVCGNSDYQIQFTFDSMWDEYDDKNARFIWNNQYIDVPFSGNICDVPVITDANEVTIGVYAGDIRTTTGATIHCQRSILCGGARPNPETDKNYASEAQEAAKEAKAYAELAATYTEEITSIANENGIVPDYWIAELETKADVIQTAMETAGRNKSAFLWYTDAHWQSNSKISPILLKYLVKNTPMNKVCFGGDIVSDPIPHTHENTKYIHEWRNFVSDLPNHHSVYGNHDVNHRTMDVSDMAYAHLLASEESADMVVGGDSYYYIDNPAEKTRYLYLSYFTNSHTDMLAQGEFIITALSSVAEGWHIVVIAHRWWQYTSATAPTIGSVPTYEKEILSILDTYNARGTRSSSNYFNAQDFTKAKGKVEFCIGGHIHVDYDFESDGGIPVIITTADANQNRVPDSDIDSGTIGTTTEAAVFGIIADYNDSESTKITVVGVGRGTSRIITTDGSVVIYNKITNNLTNCVNSNTSTSIESGASYSATITAKDGYTLESVNVTMGGSAVSVTDGVINIASVTGDIVITANAIESASPTPTPTNEITTSIESDGTPFNGGVGYITGKRLSSSGVVKDTTNCVTSGFIPYSGGVIEVVLPNTVASSGNNYVHLYDSSFTGNFKTADGTVIDGSSRQAHQWLNHGATRTIDAETQTMTLTIPAESIHSDVAYIRVSGDANTTIDDSTFRVSFQK